MKVNKVFQNPIIEKCEEANHVKGKYVQWLLGRPPSTFLESCFLDVMEGQMSSWIKNSNLSDYQKKRLGEISLRLIDEQAYVLKKQRENNLMEILKTKKNSERKGVIMKTKIKERHIMIVEDENVCSDK